MNEQTKAALAKFAEKKKQEPTMVQQTRFMDQSGKTYWAKSKKSQHDCEFPMQTRLVEAGSKEDI